jgi:hypothetical protein
MTRALTRTNFHSSRLIRTLADLAVLETAGPAAAVGEKLGLWIDFADAIALTRVLNANQREVPGKQAAQATTLAQDFAAARASLERVVTKNGAAPSGRARADLALPALDAPLDDTRVYAPFRRYHLAHQRDMENSVRSLRNKVRDGVAAASPALRQLAAVDAAFEGILGEREARLLANLPGLMEKRFNQLRKAHLQTRQDLAPDDDKPEQWMQPGAWLARFCTELQTVLLAELDLRLQPAVGLLEALHNEKNLQPV